MTETGYRQRRRPPGRSGRPLPRRSASSGGSSTRSAPPRRRASCRSQRVVGDPQPDEQEVARRAGRPGRPGSSRRPSAPAGPAPGSPGCRPGEGDEQALRPGRARWRPPAPRPATSSTVMASTRSSRNSRTSSARRHQPSRYQRPSTGRPASGRRHARWSRRGPGRSRSGAAGGPRPARRADLGQRALRLDLDPDLAAGQRGTPPRQPRA